MDTDVQKRIINIRYIFVLFLGLMLGILFVTRLYSDYSFNDIAIMVGVGMLTAYSIIIIVCAICRNTHAKKYMLFAILFIISLLLGGGYMSLRIYMYNAACTDYEDTTIVGRVTKQSGEYFELDEIVVSDGDETKNLSYHARVYDDGSMLIGDNRTLGTIVQFRGMLSKIGISDRFFGSIADRIGYYATPLGAVEAIGTKDSFSHMTYKLVYDKLSSVIDDRDVVSVEMALIFGDQDNIRQEYFDVYTATGLVHILAVSGLNTSVFVLAINYILKKIRCNKYIRFAAVGVVLILYCTLCNFEPSCVRAGLMSMILMAGTDLFGRMSDILSSFSLAGLIILLFNPFRLFDLGFQLSFMCVISIVTLSGYIERALLWAKCPKWLASSLSLSIGVTVGLFPGMTLTFDSISFVSVFANIFAIPLFTFFYVVLLITLLIALVVPFFEYVLYLPYYIMCGINWMIYPLSKLEFLIIPAKKMTALSYISILFVMIIAKYLMVDVSIKTVLITILIAVFTVEVTLSYSTKFSGIDRLVITPDAIIMEQNYRYTMVVTDMSGVDTELISRHFRINDVDDIIVLDYDGDSGKLYSLAKYFFAENCYIAGPIDFDHIANANVSSESDYLKFNDKGVELTFRGEKYLIVSDSISALKLDEVAKTHYNYVIVSLSTSSFAGDSSDCVICLSTMEIKYNNKVFVPLEIRSEAVDYLEVALNEI